MEIFMNILKHNEQNLQGVLEEFRERYARKGKKIKTDGIICPEIFHKTTPKILWVLKEFNGGNDTEEGDILEDLRNCARNKNLGDYIKTYKMLVKTSWLILRNNWEQDILLVKEEDKTPGADILCADVLPQIAVINVKKICGYGRTKDNDAEIKNAYSEFKDLILKQIDLISPDIVINASHVEELFNDLTDLNLNDRTKKEHFLYKQSYWLDYLGRGSGCFTWAKNKNKIVLQVYHPETPKGDKTKPEYMRAVLQCLIKSLK